MYAQLDIVDILLTQVVANAPKSTYNTTPRELLAVQTKLPETVNHPQVCGSSNKCTQLYSRLRLDCM